MGSPQPVPLPGLYTIRTMLPWGLLLLLIALQLPSWHSFRGKNSINNLSPVQWTILTEGLEQCKRQHPTPRAAPLSPTWTNPRWNPATSPHPIRLCNATLFDGERFSTEPVDISFSQGIITSISQISHDASSCNDVSSSSQTHEQKQIVVNLQGQFVTPGLVDMHSHHLLRSWPEFSLAIDDNEVHPSTGSILPFVRALDGMKPADPAVALIAAGGVTSSLILPGSANIIGGEAFVVKNRAAPWGEVSVEDMLLESGIPVEQRRRYMKMACGENPMRVHGHTRLGHAWKIRQHLSHAHSLMNQQDAWCQAATTARDTADYSTIAELTRPGQVYPKEDIELESTIALLRGEIDAHIHCYETQDMETMVRHSQEFGFRIAAFHHALDAWKIPELIKAAGYAQGKNITIASFSDYGFFKREALGANLNAGRLLEESQVPVAYVSDHVHSRRSARYLLFQAAHAHSYGLSGGMALASVTSVPAKALGLDHRVGYVRSGYDADLVVWDSHPLELGATPVRVYIDGEEVLGGRVVEETLAKKRTRVQRETQLQQQQRQSNLTFDKKETCERIQSFSEKIAITGILWSYLNVSKSVISSADEKAIILQGGRMLCFGNIDTCNPSAHNATEIRLQNGHVLPGITAYTDGLGLYEIGPMDETADGMANDDIDPKNPASVIYAKDGVHLEGRAFDRSRAGGVTRAITAPPKKKGLLRGVSAGIKISGNTTDLDERIFRESVALHFAVGQTSKGTSKVPTISSAVQALRAILADNHGEDNIYGMAAGGKIPVIVHAENQYDIQRVLRIKEEQPDIHLVLVGASEAHLVVDKLVRLNVPVIITAPRGQSDTVERTNMLVGPPLTASLVQALDEAGVQFAIADSGEGAEDGLSYIQNLLLEAAWAAQYAGLPDERAVSLVSTELENILGIPATEGLVLYEGSPFQFGSRALLTVDGGLNTVVECFPDPV
ncbi:hypothetical protein PHISCL_04170 [Aspergillus sclerotialis]|uniref:Amidohydrolase-related domain-containing protein n=1 Tax=Aspergillus sclerotialis TaxID=2070753 RepID=A0A3A3A2C5_9EURO|nr:hypothetical protein PHISCL_04170 [Aspergillus sclerotialis]